jgi:hypothetical protein
MNAAEIVQATEHCRNRQAVGGLTALLNDAGAGSA